MVVALDCRLEVLVGDYKLEFVVFGRLEVCWVGNKVMVGY
jgi:hypothetical protein